MKGLIAIGIFTSFTWITSSAQAVSVTSDGSSPDASAMLDIKSTTSGLLVPRMTSAQRSGIADPAVGLIVFDTDDSTLYYRTNTNWLSFRHALILEDSDQDTKIQVEEGADEDIIRFDLAGQERWVMRGGRLEPVNTGYSVWIGDHAGASDDLSYNRSVAVGDSALALSTSGEFNTSVGHTSLSSNTIGSHNTATGFRSLYSNTTGNDNTATGYQTLYSSANGARNTGMGFQALYSATVGGNNTATGYQALYSNTMGYDNSATGFQTLFYNNTGVGNVATGLQALYFNSTGSSNTATGYQALYSNTIGGNNTATGVQALYSNTTGLKNTAIGWNANVSSGDLVNSTAIGANAIVSQDSSLVLGDHANVGIGISSPVELLHISGGNVLIDRKTTTSGLTRVMTIGGARNSAGNPFAQIDFQNIDDDNANTDYVGARISSENTNATDDGDLRFATNNSTLTTRMVISPTGDVGIGTVSPNELLEIAGDGRAFFGNGGGSNRKGLLIDGVWGADGTRIEAYDYSAGSGLNLHINTVGLGNVGIRNNSPNVALDVIGDIEYTGTIMDVSDRKLKENVELVNNALGNLLALNPVTYNMFGDDITHREYGLIAQEVQPLFPDIVSIVDTEHGYLGVSYIQLVPVLIRGMQEQQEIIENLQTRIDTQEQEISRLQEFENRLVAIEQLLVTTYR